MKSFDDTKCFWHNNSDLSAIAESLESLIPAQGEVENAKKNPALEKFRKAANLYYEIFNNGCMNSMQGFKPIFGESAAEIRQMAKYRMWSQIIHRIEPMMEQIVIAAAAEQLKK